MRQSHRYLNAGLALAVLALLVFSYSTAAFGASAVFGGGMGLSSSIAYIRVNQVGYLPSDYKRAVLISSSRSYAKAQFEIVNEGSGSPVFVGNVGESLGKWNSNYPYTYLIDFSALNSTGTYFVRLSSNPSVASPIFQIGSAQTLYYPLLADALFFYQAQQDGPIVNSSVLDRQPSHLTDDDATVYQTPVYTKGVLQGNLVPIGEPVDVAGGWFDAGDYLKFVETASYTDAIMLFAVREYPALMDSQSSNFTAEAMYGLNWLQEMWNQTTKTLYYQVGIGNGNRNITPDHNLWRLPQADDALNVTEGSKLYYIKYRPVFEAGPPGSPISPNLAGMLTADFALCYQVYHSSDPSYADKCLVEAETVFELAKTSDVGQLLTTAPHNYYPQTTWKEDLELGATELYFALATASASNSPVLANLPHTDPMYYLKVAAHWANAYIKAPKSSEDSLNLYDVGGLAHYELYDAITQAGNPGGLEVTKAELLQDLNYQLSTGAAQSQKDPFGLGIAYGGLDATPHALGFVMESEFYDSLTNTTKYAAFAEMERDWVFGENAWGSSFVVGVGDTFPDCLQSQVANLVGSLNGTPPLLLYGATVDGPNSLSSFKGLGYVENPPILGGGMLKCPVGGGDPYAQFTGHGGRYLDNVIAWPSTEPADDYTALTILVYASQGEK